MHIKSKQPPLSNAHGFTIIEILIVLTIAALIMVIVLIAVPAMQRNSRNYQRKHAAELIAAGLEQFKINSGHFPRTEAEFDQFVDGMPEVTNGPVKIEFQPTGNTHAYWPEQDTVAIQYAHWCNTGGGDDPIDGDDANANFYAVWTQLEPDDTENPENRNTFCVDNHAD